MPRPCAKPCWPRQGQAIEEGEPAAVSRRRRSRARSRRRPRRTRLYRRHPDHLPDDPGRPICRARLPTALPPTGSRRVLHYSRRSARAFLEAARAAGVEISALAIPQCCISDAVASIVRDAGATQVLTARTAGRKCLIGHTDACFAAPDRAKRTPNLVRSGPDTGNIRDGRRQAARQGWRSADETGWTTRRRRIPAGPGARRRPSTSKPRKFPAKPAM